jgi:hypothetical protein
MSRSENKMAQAANAAVFDIREGERRLDVDPAALTPDAGPVFIGRVSSPWVRREDCPKNMTQARERVTRPGYIVDPVYREGLAGLEGLQPH